jgi:phenylalanyl-tRNA synthetase beta chain
MKLTLSWLKEYLDTSSPLEKIAKKLTDIGLEVEKIDDRSKALSDFFVAEIISTDQHPNSTKLTVCKVKSGDGRILQIVCGANNAKKGLKTALAMVGSTIPSNLTQIKKAKIAEVESEGMLCSAFELGLPKDLQNDGIVEIDKKWEVGTAISDALELDDLIEINVTPNRGDCLGIYGVARDLSASGIGMLKNLETSKECGDFLFPIETSNNATSACNYVSFRYIKNVKNCESPKWLKNKIESVGINSISAIVDITNFVMLSLNRPMHAYDANKIKGGLTIRFAENDEKFTSLSDEKYILNSEDLVISDEEKTLGIAGIIGGNDSSCNLNTTEIILESAYFDPIFIAKTGRKLSILTDSRYRFERGIDPNSCKDGIDLATKLILEVCGGSASEIKTANGTEIENRKIEFCTDEIEKLIGVAMPTNTAFEILSKLGFVCDKVSEKTAIVKVPSFRGDILDSADLVEEVIRIYGYDKIEPKKLEEKNDFDNFNILHKARQALASSGMIETINWSFCNTNFASIFGDKNDGLVLENPISEDLNYMRPNLIIGLLASYGKNYGRSFANLSLFEIGNIFINASNSGQKQMISGIRAGKNKPEDHYKDVADFDIFDVKQDFLNIVEIYGISESSLQISEDSAPAYYNPHRFASVKLGRNLIGYFGEIHPKITKKFDLKIDINAFEIFVDNLPKPHKSSARKNLEIVDFPFVERDFAFLIDENKAVYDIIKIIKSLDKSLIKQVNIFDIYKSESLGSGVKSIAVKVILQSKEKSLTSSEIENISKNIILEVEKKFGGKIR